MAILECGCSDSRATSEITPCHFSQNGKPLLSSAIGFATPVTSPPNSCPTSSALPAGAFLRRAERQSARIERLIQSQAWTDAALALIDLELPQWQVRRLAYDDGEWYCALSRQRELPDWLDQSIETRHADLALAILSAFVEAQRVSAPSSRTSVPTAPRRADIVRADVQRQFRLTRGLRATLAEPAATTAIGPGPDPVWCPPACPGRVRQLQQHRIQSKPDGFVLDGWGPLRRDRLHSARPASRSRSQPLGRGRCL